MTKGRSLPNLYVDMAHEGETEKKYMKILQLSIPAIANKLKKNIGFIWKFWYYWSISNAIIKDFQVTI